MPFGVTTAPEAVGLSSSGLLAAFEHFRSATSPLGQPLSGGVLVVSRQGKVCFVESFGVRDEIGGELMSSDCLFDIASMTKSVTVVAAMILHEEAKLGLDDPVSKWLPALAEENLRVVGSHGSTLPCKNPILVRHLMTHTSGWSYGIMFRRPDGDPMGPADEATSSSFTPKEPKDFAKCVLAFQPGTRFRYSPATQLLGHVVEAASGLSLEDFFRSRIFGPLGMTRTSYRVGEEHLPLLARPQLGTENRVAKPSAQTMFDCLLESDKGAPGPGHLSPFPGKPGRSPVTGQGGLHSSPEDWNRFGTMLAQRGRGLMSEETFRLMTSPMTPSLDDAFFNTHMTDKPGSGGTFLCGQHSPMGLGGLAHSLLGEVAIGENAMGGSIGAFGWEGLSCTKYFVDPLEELSVSFFANVAPSWRFALKQEVLPLIYRSLTAPRAAHRAVRRSKL